MTSQLMVKASRMLSFQSPSALGSLIKLKRVILHPPEKLKNASKSSCLIIAGRTISFQRTKTSSAKVEIIVVRGTAVASRHGTVGYVVETSRYHGG